MGKVDSKVWLILKDVWDLVGLFFMMLYYYLRAIYRSFVPAEPKSLVGKVILVSSFEQFSLKLVFFYVCFTKLHFLDHRFCWRNRKTNMHSVG